MHISNEKTSICNQAMEIFPMLLINQQLSMVFLLSVYVDFCFPCRTAIAHLLYCNPIPSLISGFGGDY